jgi:hypothetical protein
VSLHGQPFSSPSSMVDSSLIITLPFHNVRPGNEKHVSQKNKKKTFGETLFALTYYPYQNTILLFVTTKLLGKARIIVQDFNFDCGHICVQVMIFDITKKCSRNCDNAISIFV